MTEYIYECIDRQGQIVKGRLSAENEISAIEKLKKMELMILDIKQTDLNSKRRKSLFSKKVTLGELAMFSKQLATMINVGIPVTRALFAISEQTGNPVFKDALINIAENIESGRDLSDAFGMYPGIFSNLYISMLHSGEVGGNLDEALNRLSDQLQKEKTLTDNIKASTFYPRMVAGFAIILFISMLVFMVPIFQGFIPENVPVPAITAFVFLLSESLRGKWYIWLSMTAGIILLILLFIKSPLGKRFWEEIKLKIPIFGPMLHKSVLARFSRTLSTLLEGGIPVIQALESAGSTSGSLLISEAIAEAAEQIIQGRNISEQLEGNKLFPPMMIQMIAIGEETGSISSMLDKLAEFYEEEVATLTKGLTALLEPIMLVIVGIIIGAMIVALYLPIFTAITQAGF
ncbi:MAG TPA: type II secretion system F family protein [Clostridiaceae bacterium]|nr:type II secretion system F family protein [Clostridiaceae bacterium]